MSTNNVAHDQTATLPTFTSVRDQTDRRFSYAESSNASSSRAPAGSFQSRSDKDSEMGTSPSLREENDRKENTNKHNNANGTIRRLKRDSGGFLLESSPTSSRLSRSVLSRKSVKGKERLDEPPLSVAKRRAQLDGKGSQPSTRGSPLSFGVKSSPAGPPVPIVSQQPQHSPSDRWLGSSLESQQSGTSRKDVPSYGFDTDPAQIVDMALKLSEGRRRQASVRRQVSTATRERTAVSTLSSVSPVPSPGKGAEQGYGTLRKAMQRKSLIPDPQTPQKQDHQMSGRSTKASPLATERFSPEADTEVDEEDMQISRATQNRVAKAKAYFELAYEHRRLLSHLPPLRRTDEKFDPSKPGYDSRAYNPLQYARNRKLRFRERVPINSEVDGWHDTEKVRNWVDAVVNSHTETKHDPLECVRLPPLTLHEKAGSGTLQASKPQRPRSDWVTHPAGLIADAFWTEQGLNKQKIYDRDNAPIYPQGTQFRFSGWRNRTPVEVPQNLQQDVSTETDSSGMEEKERQVGAAPDLPTFESAHKDHSWARTRGKFSKALKKSSKRQKKEDNRIFDTSSESSDSSGSSQDEKQGRGRKRLYKRRKKLSMPDGDPLPSAAQTAERDGSLTQPAQGRSSMQGSRRESVEHASPLKHLQRRSTSMSRPDDSIEKQKSNKRRHFLDNFRLDSEHDRGRSSFENDSTAPTTPAIPGFPSIAMDLSPPESRSPSPSRRVRDSFFGAVKDKMHNLPKDKVGRTDFAKENDTDKDTSKRNSLSHFKHFSVEHSRGSSPMSRGTSPFTRHRAQLPVDEPVPAVAEHRGSNLSKTSTRTADPGHHRSHRVRGMFKGGRIAELVGNEVSRVGDYIWKREPPRRSTTDGGSSSGYESDSDDLTNEKLARNPPPPRAEKPSPTHLQTSARSTTPASKTQKTSPREKQSPQYHFQGLPSFTSPFQKDREFQERRNGPQSPGGTPQQQQDGEFDSDPVSTAARKMRAAGKSPRMDRLQPPRLDIQVATPSPERRKSYGFGTALDLTRTKSASNLYSSAINGQSSEPKTRQKMDSRSWCRADPFSSGRSLTRTTTGEEAGRESSAHPAKPVTKQDFVRTRALLVATAIKATNVSRYCDDIPKPQSSFLYSAFHITNAPGSEINKHLPARRREEHALAAHHLINHLSKQSTSFNDTLSHFTSTTTHKLHRDIQVLEDKTESSLFPRLRELSDQVGQLAQKLTTTSTLAVKGVNDEVAEAQKMKRRGPYRLGRVIGYKIAEWGVVGVLWGIWAIVTVVRFAVGLIGRVWIGVAWLFWLR